jgi:hypothetical protein
MLLLSLAWKFYLWKKWGDISFKDSDKQFCTRVLFEILEIAKKKIANHSLMMERIIEGDTGQVLLSFYATIVILKE